MASRGGRDTRSGRMFFELFEEGDWQSSGKNLSSKIIYMFKINDCN
jgi:hypothetical protein